MTIEKTITLDDGYVIEIHYDEDAGNPFKENDGSPTLVLHDKAEKRFGWTNDGEWHTRLNCALDDMRERIRDRRSGQWNLGLLRRHGGYREYGLEVVRRWARAFWGVRVMLPVGAAEHSNTWVYIGTGGAVGDLVGWDSGWVGWLFATAEQIEEWGFQGDDEALERSLRASFGEFAAWVGGAVYGYVVKHEARTIADDSCWGFYGDECFAERTERETAAQHLLPGTRVRLPDGTEDVVESIRDEIGWLTEPHWGGRSPSVLRGVITVFWEGRSPSVFQETDPVMVVCPGYMREQFMEVVEHDRHAFVEAEEARARTEDEDNAEIAEMAAAEIGTTLGRGLRFVSHEEDARILRKTNFGTPV